MNRNHWLAAVAIGVGVLAFVGIPARATYGARTSADEPQYLLSATSLAEDLDLDISDELRDGAYAPYHEIPLDPQTIPLDASGRQVSPHDPLLPVLLAIPMALGGWVGAKAFLAVIATLTATLAAALTINRYGVRPRTAALVITASFGGIPLAAYGTQVYPEMPAALALLIAVAAMTAGPDDERGLTRVHAYVTLGALVAMPWLAIKYVPVAAVAGIGLIIRTRHNRRLVSELVTLAVLAGIGFVAAHQWIYGGWTAYASGDHFADTGEFSALGTDIDLVGRSRRITGLLVDRSFGIAAWSPVWFLLPVAAATAVRHGSRAQRLLAALVAASWLNAGFLALTMHGWWVPGRQLVVALPLAAILLAGWIDTSGRRLVAAIALGTLGAINWIWLAVEAATDRRTLIVDFADTAAPLHRLISPVLPDGIAATATDTALLLAWTAVILVSAGIGSQRCPEPHCSHHVIEPGQQGVADRPPPPRRSKFRRRG